MPETMGKALCKLDGVAPACVQLAAIGRNETRDGRVFIVDDPDALVADFDARAVDLPIDYHHQHDKPPQGHVGPIPAAGWIKSLYHDASGVWGQVEWTAQAHDLIGQRAFRYLSPVINHFADGRVGRIAGASLVHNPAMHLTALASQEADMPEGELSPETLRERLGLPADATAADVVKLIAKLLKDELEGGADPFHTEPDPAKYVPIEAMKDALRERNKGTATLSEQRTHAKVEDAFRKGYITAAMRGWATSLCAADEASFEAFLSSTAPAYAGLHRPSGTTAARPPFASDGAAERGDPAMTSICAQLGLKPEQLA